jgi:4-amino-4-deoxy-L-arabinose transferase-like glycosyltransferase
MAKPDLKSFFQPANIRWILFAAVICFVYFFAIGAIPLLGPDEPRYAQVAREMFERGDWVTPTLGGYNWFEKPALLYWLQIASYYIFGVSEFSARLGPALCGLLTVLGLYLFGRRLFENERFANYLAIISASTIGLLVFSRGASFDIILTFTVTGALLCFFLAQKSGESGDSEEKEEFGFYAGFYIFIGLALLAKGLIGLVLPFGVIAFYFLLTRQFFPVKFLISLSWGILITLMIAAIWYGPVYLRNGRPFVREFIVNHHFARYLSTVHAHPQPFYFFWLVLPALTFPWLPFFLSALWRSWKWNFRKPETPLDRMRLFALAWILFPLLFFSASGSKLPGYILPALPACCLLIADVTVQFVGTSKLRAYFVKSTALITFACVIIALQSYVPGLVKNDTVKYVLADADARGYQRAQVINLHDTFHSAEFYAAGRLIRNMNDGRQKKFEGVGDIFRAYQDPLSVDVNHKVELPALVLVPPAHINELTDNPWFNATVLSSNKEFLLVSLDSAKQ